jgi:hypothetical protein
VPGRSTRSLASMGSASRFETPDKAFTLVHDPEQHGAIGFEGFAWHTHDDMLEWFDVEPQIRSVPQLIEALESGRLVVALSMGDGEVLDVWITDDPVSELSGELPAGQSVTLRYWSGQPYHAG